MQISSSNSVISTPLSVENSLQNTDSESIPEILSTAEPTQSETQIKSEFSSWIISVQNTEVDAVTGATFSSKGIMSAVANALTSAKRQ